MQQLYVHALRMYMDVNLLSRIFPRLCASVSIKCVCFMYQFLTECICIKYYFLFIKIVAMLFVTYSSPTFITGDP